MQWRRRRKTFYVIGSAKHALLIKHYPLFSSGGGSGNEDDAGSTIATPSSDSRHNFRRKDRKLVHTETHIFNDEEYTKIQTPRQDLLFKKGTYSKSKKIDTVSEERAEEGNIVLIDNHSIEDSYGEDEEVEEEEEIGEESLNVAGEAQEGCYPDNGQVYMEQYCYVDANGQYYTTDVPVAYVDNYGAAQAQPMYAMPMVPSPYVVTYPVPWAVRVQPMELYSRTPSEAQYYYAMSNQPSSLPTHLPENTSPDVTQEVPSSEEKTTTEQPPETTPSPPTTPTQKTSSKSPTLSESTESSRGPAYMYPGYAFGTSMNCTHGAIRVPNSPEQSTSAPVETLPTSPPLTPSEEKRKRKRKKRHKKKNSDKIVNPENFNESFEEVVKHTAQSEPEGEAEPNSCLQESRPEETGQLLLESKQKLQLEESMETNQLLLESQQMLQMEENKREHPDPDVENEKDSAYEKSISSPETLEPLELEDRHYDVHMEMEKEKGVEPDEGIEYGAQSDENGHTSSGSTESSPQLPNSLPTMCSSLTDKSSPSIKENQPVLPQDNPLDENEIESTSDLALSSAAEPDDPVSSNCSVASDIIYDHLQMPSASAVEEDRAQASDEEESQDNLLMFDDERTESLQEVRIQSRENRQVLLTQDTDSEPESSILEEEVTTIQEPKFDSNPDEVDPFPEVEAVLKERPVPEEVTQLAEDLIKNVIGKAVAIVETTVTADVETETKLSQSIVTEISNVQSNEVLSSQPEITEAISPLEAENPLPSEHVDHSSLEGAIILPSESSSAEEGYVSSKEETCLPMEEPTSSSLEDAYVSSKEKMCLSMEEPTSSPLEDAYASLKEEVPLTAEEPTTSPLEDAHVSSKEEACLPIEEPTSSPSDDASVSSKEEMCLTTEEPTSSPLEDTHVLSKEETCLPKEEPTSSSLEDASVSSKKEVCLPTEEPTSSSLQDASVSSTEEPTSSPLEDVYISSKEETCLPTEEPTSSPLQEAPDLSSEETIQSSLQEPVSTEAVYSTSIEESIDRTELSECAKDDTFHTAPSELSFDIKHLPETPSSPSNDLSSPRCSTPLSVDSNDTERPILTAVEKWLAQQSLEQTFNTNTSLKAEDDESDEEENSVTHSKNVLVNSLLAPSSKCSARASTVSHATAVSMDGVSGRVGSSISYQTSNILGLLNNDDPQEIYSPMKYSKYYHLGMAIDEDSSSKSDDEIFDIDLDAKSPEDATGFSASSSSPKLEGISAEKQAEPSPFKFTRPDSEIVVHTASDVASECGSEDVDLLTHRYHTTPTAASSNKLSLAAELLEQVDDPGYQTKLLLIPSDQVRHGNKAILEQHYGSRPRAEIYDSGISSDDSGDEYYESFLKHRIQGISYRDVNPANSLIFRTLREEGPVPCGVCCVIQ